MKWSKEERKKGKKGIEKYKEKGKKGDKKTMYIYSENQKLQWFW